MGTNIDKVRTDAKVATRDALAAIEKLAGNIELKLHLAKMDAKDEWKQKLEPRLVEAREHARKATAEADAALRGTFRAFEDFFNKL